MSTSATDVVVTGLGATTPLGGDVATTWDALLAGRSGVSRITDDWIKDFPAQLVARLAADPAEQIDRVRARRLDRSQQVAVIAAEEAWRDSGAGDAGVDPLRIAVVFGTGIGGALTLLGQDDVLEEKGPKRVSPFTIPMLMPNGPAAAVGLAVGAKGGVHAPVSACASGAEADPLGPGPAPLRPRRRRPRRRHRGLRAPAAHGRLRRDARDEHPQRRARARLAPVRQGPRRLRARRGRGRAGARARGRRQGPRRPRSTPGSPAPAAPPTATTWSPRTPRARAPAGRSPPRCATPGSSPTDIGHVNAHATSTPVGDTAEAAAIRNSLGEHVLVSATKSQTGHLLGAAGALESVFTILALREQIVPATANLDDPDDDAAVQALDIVRREPRRATLTAAVNDSFGFGGHNIALVFTTA